MIVVVVVVVVVVVISIWRRRKTEKEMKENIWRRKMVTPTDRPTNRANIVQSAFSKGGK